MKEMCNYWVHAYANKGQVFCVFPSGEKADPANIVHASGYYLAPESRAEKVDEAVAQACVRHMAQAAYQQAHQTEKLIDL